MSRKPKGPGPWGDDMRIALKPAEHEVLDFVEVAAPTWGVMNSSSLIEKSRITVSQAAFSGTLAGRRDRAVEAAASLILAIIAMDAGR